MTNARIPEIWLAEIQAGTAFGKRAEQALARMELSQRPVLRQSFIPNTAGERVGTALKARIRRIAEIRASKGCGCQSLADEMDRNGIAWCEANRQSIVGHLLRNRGMLGEAIADAGTTLHSMLGWALNLPLAERVLKVGAEWLLNAAIEDARSQPNQSHEGRQFLLERFRRRPRIGGHWVRSNQFVGSALRIRIEGLQAGGCTVLNCTEIVSRMDTWGIQRCERERANILAELLKGFEATDPSTMATLINRATEADFSAGGVSRFSLLRNESMNEEFRVFATWLLEKSIEDVKARPSEPRPPQRFVYVPDPAWTSETRHLTYHVWATKKHDGWKWNLEQLSRRWDLFNGTKILGIALSRDAYSDDDVAGFAQSLGMKFDHVVAVANNSTLREVVTWIPMLRLLNPARASHSEVVFSAHAKGVRHNDLSNTLETWSRIMYEACLDDWPKVESQLQQFLATGCFKRYNNFTTPGKRLLALQRNFFSGGDFGNWVNAIGTLSISDSLAQKVGLDCMRRTKKPGVFFWMKLAICIMPGTCEIPLSLCGSVRNEA